MLHRVPRQLRYNKEHIYEPLVIPLGPYHHSREPNFQVAEQLKIELQDIHCSDKGFLLGKILERIDDVKHFYDTGGYGIYDEKLAEMMLNDAHFLLSYMERNENFDLMSRRLGMSRAFFLAGDVYKLENQSPLWLINLLIPLIFQGEQSQSLLCKFFSLNAFLDQNMIYLPWGNGEEEELLHLLEAIQRFRFHFIKKQDSSNSLRLMNKYSQPRKKRSATEVEAASRLNSPFWSVTHLKAKGVHFRKSSPCLRDIQFSSIAFYAQFHLPFFYITNNTIVLYSNLIEFEMSWETETHLGVTSYISLMKTLIERAEDVKVLRERGILYSKLATDEEVVLNSIDTYGFCNFKDDLFHEVKMRIDDHCKSKAKTWIAELINTKFRSPWTIT